MMSVSASFNLRRIQSARHVRKVRAFAYNWLENCEMDQEEMKKRFDDADADGNGTLNKDEVKEIMEQIGEQLCPGLNIPEQHTDALFEITDEDGDGTISRHEFPLVVFCLTLPFCIECGLIFGNPDPEPDEECLKCSQCPVGPASATACYCRKCYGTRVGLTGRMKCGHGGQEPMHCKDFLDNLKTLVDEPVNDQILPSASQSLDGAWVRCECCNKPHMKMNGYHANEHVHMTPDGRWYCEFCAARSCRKCGQWAWVSGRADCEILGCRRAGWQHPVDCKGALDCKPSLATLRDAPYEASRAQHCDTCQLFMPFWEQVLYKKQQKERMNTVFSVVDKFGRGMAAQASKCSIS